jgi:hypothetical protein
MEALTISRRSQVQECQGIRGAGRPRILETDIGGERCVTHALGIDPSEPSRLETVSSNWMIWSHGQRLEQDYARRRGRVTLSKTS